MFLLRVIQKNQFNLPGRMKPLFALVDLRPRDDRGLPTANPVNPAAHYGLQFKWQMRHHRDPALVLWGCLYTKLKFTIGNEE